MATVVLSGWLTKQGGSRGGRKNWKTRYFVLSEKHLLYFKNDKSRDRLLGEFTCDDLTAVAVTSATGSKDGFLFDLIYPTRTMRVTTASESDRQNWIDAINQPSEYSGPKVAKAKRPSRSFLRRPSGGGHLRARSEGSRFRTRSMPSRVATGGAAPCSACGKTAYPMESITCDGTTYHKKCFRCKECNGKLTVGGYAMIHGDAYCKPHFKQLFQASGGKYDRAFGSIYENSSDPLAKVIVKSKTEVPQGSDRGDLPPVADFSDGEDSLSEGEMESMHRIEKRKARTDGHLTAQPETVVDKSTLVGVGFAKHATEEKTFQEERFADKCACGANPVMKEELTDKPVQFCYHCGIRFVDSVA